jgi:hypothetical protein
MQETLIASAAESKAMADPEFIPDSTHYRTLACETMNESIKYAGEEHLVPP